MKRVRLSARMIFEAVEWCRCHDGVTVMFAAAQADPQLVRLESTGRASRVQDVDLEWLPQTSLIVFEPAKVTLRTVKLVR